MIQTVTLRIKNVYANKLRFVYSEYQMEQLVEAYTRVAGTTALNGEKKVSKSVIDHFSTMNPEYILKTDILETGMVDHYLVYGIRKLNAWRYKIEKKKPNAIEFRNMKKYDKGLFLQDLQQIDGKTILDPLTDNPSGMADTFQEIFESALDFHAPIKKEKVRAEFAPWLTPLLQKHMKNRDRLKKRQQRFLNCGLLMPDSVIM